MKKGILTMKMRGILLSMILVVAMALGMMGCGKDATLQETTNVSQEVNDGVTVLGEGQVAFNFTVVDKEGNEAQFEIHTDKTIVGDALLEHELIAGDMGEFGLYVKIVNGITADYDVDQTYWAFYVDGEYAMSGVDTTEIVAGASYMFKVEK